MSRVESRQVTEDEADVRLDRWFRRHYPDLGHGALEKLLRTGQVRVDGGRAKSNDRLSPGQTIRVPPLPEHAAPIEGQAAPPKPLRVSEADIADLKARVLYMDEAVLVLNKPPGLAVQGGTGLDRHLDAMLDLLKFGKRERPKLVHRLDKDTSGVLVLGRTAQATARLAEAFRHKTARKVYWALVVGVPKIKRGRIDLALAKMPGQAGERMMADEDEGKRAVTYYTTVDTASRRAAWLALAPVTGRTHQLRAHCQVLGTPIVGDAKYGGSAAFLTGSVSRKLHLHSRSLRIPHPDGGILSITAPLPEHMLQSWRLLGFDPDDEADHFADAFDD